MIPVTAASGVRSKSNVDELALVSDRKVKSMTSKVPTLVSDQPMMLTTPKVVLVVDLNRLIN